MASTHANLKFETYLEPIGSLQKKSSWIEKLRRCKDPEHSKRRDGNKNLRSIQGFGKAQAKEGFQKDKDSWLSSVNRLGCFFYRRSMKQTGKKTEAEAKINQKSEKFKIFMIEQC